MTAADSDLIARLRSQDHAAFETLSERHYVAIRRYLTRLTGDSESAAELTQETFLRAYQALPRLADDSDVQGWLYRIATNLARQHYRHGRLIHWREIQPHHASSGALQLEETIARQDAVRRAIEQLSLDQRACLLLYAWTGYTCAEIGQIMGRSPVAVRMLLVRARRRFRELYDERESDEGMLASGGAPRRDAPTCVGLPDTLPLYTRGDMPRESFKATTRHLESCEECRSMLAAEQALHRLLQRYLVLAFTTPRAAWHASDVLYTRRPHTQQEERDGSTEVVGVHVRKQVGRQVGKEVQHIVREEVLVRQEDWWGAEDQRRQDR